MKFIQIQFQDGDLLMFTMDRVKNIRHSMGVIRIKFIQYNHKYGISATEYQVVSDISGPGQANDNLTNLQNWMSNPNQGLVTLFE